MTLVLEQDSAAAMPPGFVSIAVVGGGPAAATVAHHALATALDGADMRSADDLTALIAMLADDMTTIDLVLFDLDAPCSGGIAGLLYLRGQFPDVPLLATASRQNGGVVRSCLEAGAAGFVSTAAETPTVARVIEAVLDGEIIEPVSADEDGGAPDPGRGESMRRLKSLTPQQLRVLTFLFGNLLNKQIAYELKVSEATVKAHVSAILQKLGVNGRSQAVEVVSRMNEGRAVERQA